MRVGAQGYTTFALFCGDLVMINMVIVDITTADKYLPDLVHNSKDNVKVDVKELAEPLTIRMEMEKQKFLQPSSRMLFSSCTR